MTLKKMAQGRARVENGCNSARRKAAEECEKEEGIKDWLAMPYAFQMAVPTLR